MALDPLATTAERCISAKPMAPLELKRWERAMDAPPSRPAITAYEGYTGDLPAYFWDGEAWVACETGEVWECPTAG